MAATAPSPINLAPLEYWRRTRYSASQVNEVCKELDANSMAARLTFDGTGNVVATVSTKTWERQEGHYPSVIEYFGEIARHPSMAGKCGSFIILLEDGLWPWFLKYTPRAPILSFGRHVQDHLSFVIPDPGYTKSKAYENEQAKVRALSPKVPWHARRPTVFWRGAASGLGIEAQDWKKCARGTLTTFAGLLGNPEMLDAKFTRISNLPAEQQDLFRAEGLVAEVVPFEEFFTYRYVVDADGYCCAWASLFLKLISGSVTLKIQSNYEQWYHRDLIPWRHYVPLASDLSDFRDCFEWLRAHDEEAQRMADDAREFVAGLTYEAALTETAELCAALLDCYHDSAAKE